MAMIRVSSAGKSNPSPFRRLAPQAHERANDFLVAVGEVSPEEFSFVIFQARKAAFNKTDAGGARLGVVVEGRPYLLQTQFHFLEYIYLKNQSSTRAGQAV